MWSLIRRYPLGFMLAVVIHLAVVALMVFGLDWLHPPKPRTSEVEIVQAKLVDAEKLRRAEEEKRKAEERKRLEAEKRRRLELERKRRLEEKKRREAEAKRRAERERKKKAEAERRRKEEARRKAEAERRRKEAERKAREAELAAQLQAEKDARERASVTAAIKRKVQNSWLRPPTVAGQDLQAKVRVRLSETGSVLVVQVVESSGNGAFDRSVEAAVYKADPLPMPSSPRLISEFRDFTFIFRPSGK